MKEKSPKSINELHYQIKAHSDILSDKALRSLWIEVPDHCHLHCQYCFANTERNKPHLAKGILTSEEYISLIEAFQEHGGQFLGIPGLGEPFHPANRALVLDIVESASKLDLQITVFTTGDALFWAMDPSRRYVDITQSAPDFSYAERLLRSNVILLVKVNSLNPVVQDKLVCQPGYTTARNAALEWLINKYHLNRSRQLGIVTSIMPENTSEIESLYEYAHANGLIFDCDTILPRGRGNAFQKTHAITCQEVRTIFSNIIRRSPGSQSGGGSYVGSSCDRVRHHLYVDVRGNAYPCIGCVDRHENLNIGNIRDRSLIDIWNDPLRLALREKYFSTVLGICSYCENFERECLSCLGRWVKEYEFFADGPVLHTQGCFNHKPDLNLWMTRCAKFIRSQISAAPLDIRKTIRNDIEAYGLEVFWKCLPDHLLDYSAENSFPLIRKDITYTDMNVPFRDLWDLIDKDKLGSTVESKKNVINSLIPRTLLPCLRLLADRYDHGFCPSPGGLGQAGKGNIQFCNLMFYQHHMHRGFYRTITHNTLDSRVLERPEHRSFVDAHRGVADQLQKDIELRNREVRLWQRWVETFEDRQGEIGLLVPHIADFSRLMEEERVDTYELILSNSLFMKHRLAIHNDIVHGGECVLNVAAILDSPLIRDRLRSVHDVVHGVATNVERWNKIEAVLSSVVFAYAGEAYSEPIKLLKDLFEDMSANAFYPSIEKAIPPAILAEIEKELQRVLRESLVSQLTVPQPTTEEDQRLAEKIRACIYEASWSDLCDMMRQLLRSRKYNNARVPNMTAL